MATCSLEDDDRVGMWSRLPLSSDIVSGCRWFLTKDRGIALFISEIVIVDAFSVEMSTVLDAI